MADGRFGCEADMAGPAAGSTRSLVTQLRHSPQSIDALQKVHSITSSASASTLFGTVKSIALAVFKLMTNK